jgi:hypothetical protein
MDRVSSLALESKVHSSLLSFLFSWVTLNSNHVKLLKTVEPFDSYYDFKVTVVFSTVLYDIEAQMVSKIVNNYY